MIKDSNIFFPGGLLVYLINLVTGIYYFKIHYFISYLEIFENKPDYYYFLNIYLYMRDKEMVHKWGRGLRDRISSGLLLSAKPEGGARSHGS